MTLQLQTFYSSKLKNIYKGCTHKNESPYLSVSIIMQTVKKIRRHITKTRINWYYVYSTEIAYSEDLLLTIVVDSCIIILPVALIFSKNV